MNGPIAYWLIRYYNHTPALHDPIAYVPYISLFSKLSKFNIAFTGMSIYQVIKGQSPTPPPRPSSFLWHLKVAKHSGDRINILQSSNPMSKNPSPRKWAFTYLLYLAKHSSFITSVFSTSYFKFPSQCRIDRPWIKEAIGALEIKFGQGTHFYTGSQLWPKGVCGLIPSFLHL